MCLHLKARQQLMKEDKRFVHRGVCCLYTKRCRRQTSRRTKRLSSLIGCCLLLNTKHASVSCAWLLCCSLGTQTIAPTWFDLFSKKQQLLCILQLSRFIFMHKHNAPVIPLGQHVMTVLHAGSGKTAAFALPILERLLYRPKRVAAIYALILTPTRELAVQVGYHLYIKRNVNDYKHQEMKSTENAIIQANKAMASVKVDSAIAQMNSVSTFFYCDRVWHPS